MSYRNQGWLTRYEKLGDQAEGKFEEVWPNRWERYGLNRPNLHLPKIPLRIRHTPDYLTDDCFVEAKGFGRDQVLKIKLSEMNCMFFWNNIHPLRIFAYDSHKDRYTDFALCELSDWIDAGVCELGYFPEPKAYVGVPAKVVFAT